MDTITVKKSNDLPISLFKIAGIPLKVKSTFMVKFASGPQKYFVVEHQESEYEVPERFCTNC